MQNQAYTERKVDLVWVLLCGIVRSHVLHLLSVYSGSEKKTKICMHVSQGRSSGVPIFTSEGQRSGLGLGLRSSRWMASQCVGTGPTFFLFMEIWLIPHGHSYCLCQPYCLQWSNLSITRLQRILPPKMPFFVRQKVQISSKILPQIPNFASFSPYENEALSAMYNC